ncbi:MAG: hypothetical protein KGJ57_14790 [Sphingomonadales bacterium]|nr:hypothetical protein [Sphingomonadales bacterium]MDE2170671.1 hypothetical protein [Sphingomonadales bacterium]
MGLGLGLIALLAGCVSAPRPAPAPPPRRVTPPVARPLAPPPKPAPAVDWRDAPITPGDWHWAREGGDSVARFGLPGTTTLALRCIAATRMVAIDMANPGSSQPMTVTIATSSQTRNLQGQTRGPWLEITFGARDNFLDAMAFSRGRFMVLASGRSGLFLPSWPEVTRVIEDCRSQ